MSLDIAILGSDGSPQKQVSIGVDDHYRLMQLIGANGGLLARLNDYYADAEFEHSEMGVLIAETTDLANRCRNDERLALFLKRLTQLSEIAHFEGKALVAIAD